jgi:hypothetical protein
MAVTAFLGMVVVVAMIMVMIVIMIVAIVRRAGTAAGITHNVTSSS